MVKFLGSGFQTSRTLVAPALERNCRMVTKDSVIPSYLGGFGGAAVEAPMRGWRSLTGFLQARMPADFRGGQMACGKVWKRGRVNDSGG